MTPAEQGDMEPQDMARWRAALMVALPAGHAVHDSTRTFTYDDLEGFETELFEMIDRDGRS